MDSLSKADDMPVAITASAILEAATEELLKKKFVYKSDELSNELFKNHGPLTGWHSKILMATALGLITPNMAAEMQSIKAIRNVFAHAKVPITFDNAILKKEIGSLKMLTAIETAEKNTANKIVLGNRAWFLLIVRILLILVDEIKDNLISDERSAARDEIEKALGFEGSATKKR